MPGLSPAPKRTTVVIALVATAVFVVGVVTSRLMSSGSSVDTSSAPLAPTEDHRPRQDSADGLTPSGEQVQVEVGFAPDEEGAVAAAVTYATASQRWLYFTDDEIRTAVNEIATPVAAPRMADQVVLDVSTAREQLATSSGRVWWLVRPLGWRVDQIADHSARVSVWTLTILSATEVAAPQAEYMTVTLDLEWIDGDWRVDYVRDTPGPTPMTGPRDQPWDAVPFDQALDGFTRMDGEPVR